MNTLNIVVLKAFYDLSYGPPSSLQIDLVQIMAKFKVNIEYNIYW